MEQEQNINSAALKYHRADPHGKLAIVATKPLTTQGDLALAYSPGVAAACNEIVRDPIQAAEMTSRGNLVAVISNGTAVLGLGAIGPLASKPVMEGKAVLFKKFSGVDVFDIEIAENDPDKLVDIVAALEPTFGGINLEDIKAPECFYVEKALRERMQIPVFHDDQHGTAIIACTAILNGLRVVNKELGEGRLVAPGAGAAALACLDLGLQLGLKVENIIVCDRKGVIYQGREESLDPYKARFAADTSYRTLDQAMAGAVIFLGLSGPGVLSPDMVAKMAPKPLILALANPTPEIMPELAKSVRPDAILATGRSDYPNQVNNVLCFPYIFRGALDTGATTINEEMKIACVHALAELTMAEQSEMVSKAYGGKPDRFGPDYLIPKPFDPRLITRVAPAVAEAAMKSGVATRLIEDMDAYKEHLEQFVFRSGFVMKPVIEQAKSRPMRLALAEGEESRILQAAQQMVDEGFAYPVLVGRPDVIDKRIEELGLRLTPGRDIEIVNPQSDTEFPRYWQAYHAALGRQGVSPHEAQTVVRTSNTVIASLMLNLGDVDAMLCGTVGRFQHHFGYVRRLIGKDAGVRDLSTLMAIILQSGTYFLCDSHVTPNPSAGELMEMTRLAAREVKRFGIEPKIAMLSHSSFGSREDESAGKVKQAVSLLKQRAPELEVDGEMHADCALSEQLRNRVLPDSTLHGQANLLVMPNLDAAHIAYGLLKVLGNGVVIGPILLGARHPAHVLTHTVTVRGIVNMAALAVVGAQGRPSESAQA